MEALFVLAFATFVAWEFLITLMPYAIAPLLQPILVVAVGYGLTYTPHTLLLSIAAAGGVALLHRFLSQNVEEPKSLPRITLPKRKRSAKVESAPPKKRRVPQL